MSDYAYETINIALESMSARSADHREAAEAFLEDREQNPPDARSPDTESG